MKQVQSDDRTLMAMQSNVSEALRPLEQAALMRGRLIESVVLSTTPTEVAHGLGRRLLGVIVVRRNADARVYEPETSTMPDRSVRLVATGNVVVSLWVF